MELRPAIFFHGKGYMFSPVLENWGVCYNYVFTNTVVAI
jgi:hypothetical protein